MRLRKLAGKFTCSRDRLKKGWKVRLKRSLGKYALSKPQFNVNSILIQSSIEFETQLLWSKFSPKVSTSKELGKFNSCRPWQPRHRNTPVKACEAPSKAN